MMIFFSFLGQKIDQFPATKSILFLCQKNGSKTAPKKRSKKVTKLDDRANAKKGKIDPIITESRRIRSEKSKWT